MAEYQESYEQAHLIYQEPATVVDPKGFALLLAPSYLGSQGTNSVPPDEKRENSGTIRLSRIKIIDGARGIAALVVVFHHVFSLHQSVFSNLFSQESMSYKVLGFISNLNYQAVLVFFIISGFSIQLSLKDMDLSKKDDVNRYLYKRFKRILPLYLFALTLAFAFGLIGGRLQEVDYKITNLFGNILFLQTAKQVKGNWFLPYGENGVLWSLSFEMFYYLIYPFFFVIFRRWSQAKDLSSRTYLVTGAMLISLLGLVTNQLVPNPISQFMSLYIVWYYGVVLADSYLLKAKSLKLAVLPLVTLLAASAFSLYRSSEVLYSWALGAMFFLTFYSYFLLRHLFFRYCTKVEKSFERLFYRIGLGSYALYLIHLPILHFFRIQVPLSSLFFFGYIIVLVSSIIILSYGLERFTLRFSYSFLKIRYIK